MAEVAEALALRSSAVWTFLPSSPRGEETSTGVLCAPGEPAGHISLNQVGRSHRSVQIKAGTEGREMVTSVASLSAPDGY